MRMLILILGLQLLFSCNKQPMPCTPPCGTEPIDTTTTTTSPKFKLKWMSRIDSAFIDKSFITSEVLANENKVFIAKRDGGPENVVLARDAETGRTIWNYSNFVDIPPGTGVNALGYSDGKVIAHSLHEVHALNVHDGTVFWSYDHQKEDNIDGYPRMLVTDNTIYNSRMRMQNSASIYSELVRSSIQNPSWEIVANFERGADGQSPFCQMPGLWKKPDGDTLIVFQNRQVQFGAPFRNKTDLYAINSRTKEEEWSIIDLQQCNCSSNVTPPYVWEDKVYFHGERSVFCIDAATGNVLWQRLMGDPVLDQVWGNNWLIEDNIYVVQTNSGNGYGLNPNTGNLIWSTTEDFGPCNRIEYHNGLVYTTWGEKLKAWDIKTGKLITEVRTSGWNTLGGVTINHDLGLLYVNDYYFTYCYELPK